MGHVLNKVLKDMTSKYHLMSGYKVNFRPGSDCHGLPTELTQDSIYSTPIEDDSVHYETDSI